MFLERLGAYLESSWGRLGWFWWRLGAIGRSLGDVLGALGGVLGALLDILEVSWRALWAMICQDLDRNPRNTKTMEKTKETYCFLAMSELVWRSWGRLGRVLGNLVGALEASWGRFGRSCGASQKL